MRQLKIMMGLTLCVALLTTGCPADGTDSGTPGTDALPGTDAGGGTDMGATDMGTPTDMGTMGFDLTLTLTEVVDMTTPVMGDVTLFDATDLMTPLGMVTTDALGMGTINLTAAVTTPVSLNTAAGHTDTWHFFAAPVTMADAVNIYIIENNALGLNYMLAGDTLDAGDATIAGRVVDGSTGAFVAGATVTSDSGTVVYISTAGLPDPMLTATEAAGQFTVFSVTAGVANLTATDGTLNGMATLPAPADTFVLAGIVAN